MPVGNQLPHGETAQGGPLKRELGERHIRLMALGACIAVSYTHLTLPTIYSV